MSRGFWNIDLQDRRVSSNFIFRDLKSTRQQRVCLGGEWGWGMDLLFLI